ncbi:MAG: hypothetical protein IT385_18075 [Deltaproteobacteria bacterium]|nr:hypothetical protein [Deltaproteobacteria bacterium]
MNTLALVVFGSALVSYASCADELPVGVVESPLGAAGDMVLICHHANDHLVEIRVNARSLPAHESHGDTLGPCHADPCADLPDGTMFCDGSGFVTCEDGESVPRDCAPGTVCIDIEGGIVCDVGVEG